MVVLHTPTLTELKAVLGDDLLGLIQLYAGSLPGQMHDLREAHRHDDVPRLRRCAHSLKGSSLSVGANGLAELAAEIERAAVPGDRTRLDPLVLCLPDMVNDTLEALREGGWLGPR